MRLNCRCSNAWPADFDKNAKDCVSTNANGADSSRLYIPTALGVGYSLMPSIAPTRVRSGGRYSIASVPNSRRVVASTSIDGDRRQRHALPLAIDQQSQILEQRRAPDLARFDSTPSGSGS